MKKFSPAPLRTDIVGRENASRPWQAWFSDIYNSIVGLSDSIDTATTSTAAITSSTYALKTQLDAHEAETTSAHGGIVANNDPRLSDDRTPLAHTQDWSTITDTPTTLSGYGITDSPTVPTFDLPLVNNSNEVSLQYESQTLGINSSNQLYSLSKAKAVRDGEKPYTDTPDVLRYKICAKTGLTTAIENPVQYMVTPGIANIDALRLLV
jgi:hypothetical protein